ncbi:ABC transporter substrate-binding protein [Nocardioides insulae]|uniref:ABC transporter substrate-binding protein n=1 Tax=Nocardioides insulae TaxID=394734 RepID=UPI0003FAB1C3|nr:ABC transporter substrate-binding protein [Nocardioides insulae]
MKSRLLTLAAGAVAATIALTGCGGSSEADDETGASAETRTVTDASGEEVEVPADPQRVVTLHYAATQSVLDLGAPLVGQGVVEEDILPEDEVEEVMAIPIVATDSSEPDLEQIAGVEPDLVLAPNTLEEEVLDQLRDVAPVYVFTLRGGDRANWTQRVDEVADALGREEEKEELATEFEARQSELAAEYADVIEGKSVGVIGAFEENNFYAWGEDNMTATILLPLGFTWSAQENAVVEGEEEPEATVSFEKIGSTVGDADILFLDSDFREQVNPFMEGLQKTTLYQDLPAVKAGHDYPGGKNTVAGYTDANYVLDRVEDALQDIQGS